MLSELEPLIKLGMEIDGELVELQGITRQYKLGMMQSMNTLRRELAKLMAELEAVWNAMYVNKQQYIAENPPPLRAQPAPLPSAPPPLPAQADERVIRLNCLNCQQSIEVNAEAEGQSFDCPTCGSKLDVGYLEHYQTPAANSLTQQPGHQTTWESSGKPATHHNLNGRLITIGSVVAILSVGILLLAALTKTRHPDAAEAEHQRKVDAVAKRIAEAQKQSDARMAEADRRILAEQSAIQNAKNQIKLKDWSFSVTSEYHGLHITDGPVIIIRYDLSNPTDYKIKFAEWTMTFSDFNDSEIKRGEWKWPVSGLKGDFILGFNNLQFNPRRVSSMSLGLKDVTLSK
jgi:hypothetical protein